MLPLEYSFDKDNDLCIWKGEAEPLEININDLLEFMKGLDNILNNDSLIFVMKRQKYGLLTIRKGLRNYFIYGKKGKYSCDEYDLIQLWNYLIESIETEGNIYIDDDPPHHPLRDLINKIKNIYSGQYIEKG